MMKTFGLLLMVGMFTAAGAQAQELTLTSTAIVSNYGPACASKGNDTEAHINQVEAVFPALRGLLQQKSVVNTDIHYVPPVSVYEPCLYQQPVCYWNGRFQTCYNQCIGGYVTRGGYNVTNSRCDTTLYLNSDNYRLNIGQGDSNALNAAKAQGNVIYDEADHGQARWVSVNQN